MGPTLPDGAMLAKVQLSVCAPTDPVTSQPLNAGYSDQLRSPLAVKGSPTAAFYALSLHDALPILSKPMAVPELTGPAGLACLSTCTEGQFTTTLSVD